MICLGDVRGLIFDLDGVLWDSNPAHAQAYAEVLGSVGITGYDFRAIAGRRTDEAIHDLLVGRGRESEPGLLDSLVRGKQARAFDLLTAAPPLVPGCGDLLRRLGHRYRLALASSSRAENIRLFLKASGTEDVFGAVLCGRDVSRAKPAPDIYRVAARRLGLRPEQALVIEDAVSGVLAGVEAGTSVVGIQGTTEASALRAAGAVDVLEHLGDLEGRLNRIWSVDSPHIQPRAIDPSRWTAIIPAAGRGSRLGYDLPKILYPILGRPILDWLLDLLEPLCESVVLILSPAGRADVEPHLRKRLAERGRVVVQPEPAGMGDAVWRAREAVTTPNCLVVWGDQVALKPQTLRACVRLHEQTPGVSLTLPTVLRQEPYIHFRRSGDGRITGIEQAREAPISVATGENDCGVFFFRSDDLFSTLTNHVQNGSARGSRTGEVNLLPIIPRLDTGIGSVVTVRLADVAQTMGINTVADARRVEQLLLGHDRERLAG